MTCNARIDIILEELYSTRRLNLWRKHMNASDIRVSVMSKHQMRNLIKKFGNNEKPSDADVELFLSRLIEECTVSVSDRVTNLHQVLRQAAR